jgi:hypothetical protein
MMYVHVGGVFLTYIVKLYAHTLARPLLLEYSAAASSQQRVAYSLLLELCRLLLYNYSITMVHVV